MTSTQRRGRAPKVLILCTGNSAALSDDRGAAQRRPLCPALLHLGLRLGLNAAVELLRSAGTPVLEEPADQPWGERVARVSDPDGSVIIVGSQPEGVSRPT